MGSKDRGKLGGMLSNCCGARKQKNALRKITGVTVDLEPLYAFERAMSGDVIWTTRDGRHVAVRDMESSHLYNTIRVLKGQSPIGTKYRCDALTRRNWIEIMTHELSKRGVIVDEANERS